MFYTFFSNLHYPCVLKMVFFYKVAIALILKEYLHMIYRNGTLVSLGFVVFLPIKCIYMYIIPDVLLGASLVLYVCRVSMMVDPCICVVFYCKMHRYFLIKCEKKTL